MYTWQQWYQYAQRMHSYIQAQSVKMADMEKDLEGLKAELSQLKEKKSIHIDKIEYKFDQLKVETLEGTLNIGMNPSAIEDLAVSKQEEGASAPAVSAQANGFNGVFEGTPPSLHGTIPGAEASQGLREEISKELMDFMGRQVPNHLVLLQAEYGHRLDNWHQQLIIEDIGRQIDQRIRFYLKQMEPGATVDQISSLKDSVIFRTKNDIQTALKNYFSKLPKKDGESE